MKRIGSSELVDIFNANDTELHKSLRELGCFVLQDCLDDQLVNSAHRAFVSLFDLSQEEKRKYLVDKKTDPLGYGFSPFGVAKALDSGIPNLLETWDISPHKENWPEQLEKEWAIIRNYQECLKKLSIAGLKIIARLLNINSVDLINLIDENSIEGIHIIHYFPLTKGYEVGARRQSMHCDNTLITLIPPPSPIRTGLSVFNRKTKAWEDVAIENSSCLVQAGLILELVTCGAIKANLHTVPNPELGSEDNVSRYSSPFFCSPRKGTKMLALEKYRGHCENNPVSIEDLEEDYFKRVF